MLATPSQKQNLDMVTWWDSLTLEIDGAWKQRLNKKNSPGTWEGMHHHMSAIEGSKSCSFASETIRNKLHTWGMNVDIWRQARANLQLSKRVQVFPLDDVRCPVM